MHDLRLTLFCMNSTWLTESILHFEGRQGRGQTTRNKHSETRHKWVHCKANFWGELFRSTLSLLWLFQSRRGSKHEEDTIRRNQRCRYLTFLLYIVEFLKYSPMQFLCIFLALCVSLMQELLPPVPPKKRALLIFYCIPVSPGNSRLIFASPRNFAVWIERIVPRWIFHIGQNLILDSDLYLLHVEVNLSSFFFADLILYYCLIDLASSVSKCCCCTLKLCFHYQLKIQ